MATYKTNAQNAMSLQKILFMIFVPSLMATVISKAATIIH